MGLRRLDVPTAIVNMMLTGGPHGPDPNDVPHDIEVVDARIVLNDDGIRVAALLVRSSTFDGPTSGNLMSAPIWSPRWRDAAGKEVARG